MRNWLFIITIIFIIQGVISLYQINKINTILDDLTGRLRVIPVDKEFYTSKNRQIKKQVLITSSFIVIGFLILFVLVYVYARIYS